MHAVVMVSNFNPVEAGNGLGDGKSQAGRCGIGGIVPVAVKNIRGGFASAVGNANATGHVADDNFSVLPVMGNCVFY